MSTPLVKNQPEKKHTDGKPAHKGGTGHHGGLALGLDRFAMLLAGKDNIREVIAFPKNSKASEPLTNAPSTVSEKQLEELYLRTENK